MPEHGTASTSPPLFERDVRDVANVKDVSNIGKLLEFLVYPCASLLNVANISRDLGLARATIVHHLEVLDRLFLIRILPAWRKTAANRLVKMPELHLLDSGLAATLTGLREDDWNSKRESSGKILESMVLQQVTAQAGWADRTLRFSHYRDEDQVEVDCVTNRGNSVWGIEVKAAQSVDSSDAKGLRRLAEKAGKDFVGGILLYSGTSILPLPGTPSWQSPYQNSGK